MLDSVGFYRKLHHPSLRHHEYRVDLKQQQTFWPKIIAAFFVRMALNDVHRHTPAHRMNFVVYVVVAVGAFVVIRSQERRHDKNKELIRFCLSSITETCDGDVGACIGYASEWCRVGRERKWEELSGKRNDFRHSFIRSVSLCFFSSSFCLPKKIGGNYTLLIVCLCMRVYRMWLELESVHVILVRPPRSCRGCKHSFGIHFEIFVSVWCVRVA